MSKSEEKSLKRQEDYFKRVSTPLGRLKEDEKVKLAREKQRQRILAKREREEEKEREQEGGNLSNSDIMVKSYCVRQKKQTECVPGTETYQKTSNGRTVMKCTCAECGITKTKFVKGKGN